MQTRLLYGLSRAYQERPAGQIGRHTNTHVTSFAFADTRYAVLNFKDIVACPSATFTNVPLRRQVCCSGLSQASGSGRTKSWVSQLLAPFFSSLTGNGCLHPFVFSVWLGLSPTLAARQHVLFGRTASAHRSQIEWGQQPLSSIPSSSIPSPTSC